MKPVNVRVYIPLFLAFLLTFEAYPAKASENAAVRKMDDTEKVVYLTFDDGPDAANTVSVMETLLKFDAQATFFFTGRNMENCPEVTKLVYDNGFPIGLHTYNHPSLTRLSAAAIRNELESTNAVLECITGERSAIMRPPNGALNDAVRSVIAQAGYTAYLWSIDPKDWSPGNDNSLVMQNIKQNLHPGAIILLHSSSGQKRASQILPELLDYLDTQGYKTKALPDPGYKSVPAVRSDAELTFNGKPLGFEPYIINGGVYVSVRDFAEALKETEKQFALYWNERQKTVHIITRIPYSSKNEVKAGVPDAKRAAPSSVSVVVNGQTANITVYSIEGSCYFNLNELARSLEMDCAVSGGAEKYVAALTFPKVR